MSRRTARIASLLAAGCVIAAGAPANAAADAAARAPSPVSAQWQHHSKSLYFQGFTSHYTCDGLEDKVRQILIFLGARSDAKVSANGCAYGPTAPSPYANVTLEFDTLSAVPAAGGAAGSARETVSAQWQPVELSANRPSFMGSGECELIEQLKPVLTSSFSLADLDYHARCAPHQITLGDYSVRGKVLRATPGK